MAYVGPNRLNNVVPSYILTDHGDYVRITENGGVVMLGKSNAKLAEILILSIFLGRSDGVLNPGGIRFGSSEIYEVLDQSFSSSAHPIILDSLVVGQTIQGGADERVILFLKLADGETLSDDLRKRIKDEIRKKRSPRHCPEKVRWVKYSWETGLTIACCPDVADSW